MSDKMLHIKVPSTELLEPVVTTQSLPSLGPKEGGSRFNKFLKTSIKTLNLVNKARKDIASMIRSRTVQVNKEICEVHKHRKKKENEKDGMYARSRKII